MHELTLCNHLIEIIKQNVQDGMRVKRVYLELGELALIEKSALLFSYKVLTKGTVLEDSTLIIIDVLGTASCHFCGKTSKITKRFEACKFCGNHSLTILTGDELQVKSMEVE